MSDLIERLRIPIYDQFESSEDLMNEAADELESAKREAESLAMSLWKKFYQEDSPNFELCNSVAGVISQIDNMTCGLLRANYER